MHVRGYLFNKTRLFGITVLFAAKRGFAADVFGSTTTQASSNKRMPNVPVYQSFYWRICVICEIFDQRRCVADDLFPHTASTAHAHRFAARYQWPGDDPVRRKKCAAAATRQSAAYGPPRKRMRSRRAWRAMELGAVAAGVAQRLRGTRFAGSCTHTNSETGTRSRHSHTWSLRAVCCTSCTRGRSKSCRCRRGRALATPPCFGTD